MGSLIRKDRIDVRVKPGPNRFPIRPGAQGGMSLVELLVVMLLMFVVMGAIYGIWQGLSRTYAFTEEDMSVQAESRAVMAEMVEYIRTARQPQSVAVTEYDTVIPKAEPFSLTLWTDTNRDGSHDLQLIRYRVSPDPLTSPGGSDFELLREQGDASTCSFDGAIPVRLVSSHLAYDEGDAPLFTYYDALGEPTTDISRIRRIEISLRVDVSPDKSPVVNVLNSTVQPRNVRH